MKNQVSGKTSNLACTVKNLGNQTVDMRRSFNEFIFIKAFLVIMLSMKSIITMNVPSVSPDSMLTFEPLIFQQTKLIIWRA